MARKRFAIASLLTLAISGCGSATDDVLAAVQDQNPAIVSFRNVHTDDVGQVCGLGIDKFGRIDRFLGHSETFETVVNLESEMDAVILKAPEMDAEFADIGPRLKLGFLNAYDDCMSS